MWSKLDDKFHMHQKAREAFKKNPAAIALWTMCLSYCGDQLTDGFVPAWYVATLLPGRKGIALADVVVDAGLWERAELSGEKGWVFHDFLVYNKSREWVHAEREKTAKRQADWRARQEEEARKRQEEEERNAVSNARPDPTRPEVVVLLVLA